MNEYIVYFEIYGKKMKVRIWANSEEDAKYKVMGKIRFHKVEPVSTVLDFLKDIMK
jgi:hypothetical protein